MDTPSTESTPSSPFRWMIAEHSNQTWDDRDKEWSGQYWKSPAVLQYWTGEAWITIPTVTLPCECHAQR